MDNEQLKAYVAGFFDGEGSITVSSSRRNSRGVNVNIAIQQNHPAPLRRCVELFPDASFTSYKGPRGNTVWRYQLGSRKVAAFLRLILPYLVLKRDEAEIAIEIAEGMLPVGGRYDDPKVVELQHARKSKLAAAKQTRIGVSYHG